MRNLSSFVQDTTLDFAFGDNMYTKAAIRDPPYVCLWLGANVMAEYGIDEAIEVLEEKLANANESLKVLRHDLEYVRDQITTTDVNVARVYNFEVKRKNQAKPMN